MNQSRLGVCMQTELGWEPIVTSWLSRRKESEAIALRSDFEKITGPLLDHIRYILTIIIIMSYGKYRISSSYHCMRMQLIHACRLHLQPAMKMQSICLVGTLLSLLSGALLPHFDDTLPLAHYKRIFNYCIAWSLGGLLNDTQRLQFDSQLRSISDEMPPKVISIFQAKIISHTTLQRLLTCTTGYRIQCTSPSSTTMWTRKVVIGFLGTKACRHGNILLTKSILIL